VGQHRIPAFHLEHFNSGKGVYIYDRRFSAWKSGRASPKRISSVKGRWPQAIEDFFKEIDTRSCDAMRKLIRGETLGLLERGYLAEYLVLMAMSRGASAHRRLMAHARGDFFQSDYTSLASKEATALREWTRGQIEALAKDPEKAKLESTPSIVAPFMAPSLRGVQHVARMRWSVYHGGPFVLSDSPAWFSRGLKYSNCRAGLALSVTAYLVCDWQRDSQRLRHVRGRAPNWLNHMTINGADREVYCHSRYPWLQRLEQRLHDPERPQRIIDSISPQSPRMESCAECHEALDACTCFPDAESACGISQKDGSWTVRVPMIGGAGKQTLHED